MEGRALAGDGNDNPPLKDELKASSTNELPPPSTALVKSTETYVVQVPRDQVYRIPPPENASIVESYRKPGNDGKQGCGGRWILILPAMIVIASGIFLAIDNFSKPKSPEFSVIHFVRKVLKSTGHSGHNSSKYEISLRVSNLNSKFEVHYGVGNVTLHFKGHEIARGQSQTVEQKGGSSITVNQPLHGTEVALPGSVEKSMNDKHPKVLTLKFDVPIEVDKWIKTFKKELIVGCDLVVDSLGHGEKLKSQNCGTD